MDERLPGMFPEGPFRVSARRKSHPAPTRCCDGAACGPGRIRRPLPLISPRTSGATPAHLAFTVALGLAGWGFLLAATYLPELGPAPSAPSGTLPFFLFLVVIVAARAMAFRLVPESVLSLDS